MPRPKNLRRITSVPDVTYFKPAGVPLYELEEVVLTVDELEALRLADADSMYHHDAAEKMEVSRQTFGRILQSARKKVASALIGGKAIKIHGGHVKSTHEAPPHSEYLRNKDITARRGRGRGQGRGKNRLL